MNRPILASLAALTLTASWAQQRPLCATDLMRQRAIAEDPEFLVHEAAYLAELDELIRNSATQRDDDQVYVIPVVFHIMHLNGRENITNEQVFNEMQILNRDWAKQNQDTSTVVQAFRDNIADMDVEFKLATIDPLGHCTNGIVRHRSAETFRGEGTSKFNPWPRSQYLNIWVVKGIMSGAAGYFSGGPPAWGDGIVILQDYVGGNCPTCTGSNYTSRALTHEVGHYLSLAHVWGTNNGVPEGAPPCHMQAVCGDDGVEDTPLTKGWSCCPTNEANPNPADPTLPWGDCAHRIYKTEVVEDVFEDGLLYPFNNVTSSSGTTDPTPVPNAVDSVDGSIHTIMSPFSAVGVSPNSSVDGTFAFSDWGTGANDGEFDYSALTGSFDGGNYYQFTLTPTSADLATPRGFTAIFSRNSSGARTFSIRSSLNNYSTNLTLTALAPIYSTIESGNIGFFNTDATEDQWIGVTLPAGGFANLLAPVTFRIYAWNAEDASGTFEVDDFRVFGESSVIENVQNYMEYSYCSRMFTHGQRDRARAALLSPTSQRDILWTEANLQATGVAPGFEMTCPPEADFYAQVGTDPTSPTVPFPPMSCVNTNVRFYDNSARAIPTAWSWTFQDGTPATSTQQNPMVQFGSPGYKTVTLTVSNDQGSTSKTDIYAVYIGSPEVALTPYYESFETMQGTDLYPYVGMNYEANHTSWHRFTGGGATGPSCAMLNSGDRNPLDFIDGDNEGDYDDFVTPILNLTGAPAAQLSFRYAYSTMTTTAAEITEYLEIKSSTDCGRTWLDRATITGTQLVTNGNNMSVPPEAWALKTLTLPGSLLSANARFRFRFVSSEFSGHIYIDDIWIGVPVGVAEIGTEGFITLFPNPTNNHFSLQVVGMESSATEITIMDLRGAVVYRTKVQPNGGSLIELSAGDMGLAEGMYMLRASNNTGSSAQKLIVGH